MRVLGLAEYVIQRATYNEQPITNLKLQKTLYYLQGYTLRVFSEPAFDEEIQNWQYGPVVPVVYFAYSNYGSNPLEVNDSNKIEDIPIGHKMLFNKVIDACLQYTARDLVQKTHEELPWKNTKLNEKISCDQIMRFFCKNNPLELDD